MKTVMSLCMITKGDKILLGMKKRGFGQGRWNGFGGKVKAPETIEESAVRELEEEVGLKVLEMKKRSVFTFTWIDKPDICEVHVFHINDYQGEPIESEEMKPKWFLQNEIPYDYMWSDDKHWLPLFLQGKNTIGEFHFDADDKLIDVEIIEVDNADDL